MCLRLHTKERIAGDFSLEPMVLSSFTSSFSVSPSSLSSQPIILIDLHFGMHREMACGFE